MTHFAASDGQQGLFQRFVVGKIKLGVALFRAVDGLEDADGLGLLFHLEIFGHVNDVGSAPVEFVLVDDLGPVGWVVAPGVFVGLAGHAGDYETIFRVGFVLTLGA